MRPLLKLFSAAEVRNLGGDVTRVSADIGLATRPTVDVYKGQRYYNGFCYRAVKANTLLTEAVNPTTEEIERFNSRLLRSKEDADGDDDEIDASAGLTAQVAAVTAPKIVKFLKNDRVKVIKGDLKNLTGRVISSNALAVTIQPDDQRLLDPLDFPRDEVRKYFKVGDHVKVEGGAHANETGLIVRIIEADDSAVLYSDVSQRELSVSTQDIVESTEVSAGKDSLGNYSLFDMVHLK